MTTIHRITIGLVLALALAVTASVRPQPGRLTSTRTARTFASGAASTQATKPSHSVSPPAVIVRVAAPGGFDWGDAGIGAAGGLALAMVGVGGAVAVSQSRARRTRRTSALPS